MNFKEIKELIEILDQSSLTEINIEDNKGSVVNLKQKETEIITPQYTQQAPLAPATSTMATPNQSATESPVPQNNDRIDKDDSSYQTINAPMVGTFINRHLQKKMHMFKSEIKLPMNLQCAS